VQLRLLSLSAFLLFSLPAYSSVIAPNLGNAASFGMLGGTISNTGTSVIVGNVGATITKTGFPPATATGTVYAAPGDPTVVAAYNDFLNAFNLSYSDVSTPSTQTLTDLTANRTLLGNNVFTFPLTDVTSTTGIELTFDAQFDSGEVFIIKTTRDLTINGPLTFTLKNGALATNIYWIIGRTATISSGGGPVTFDGNILAGTSFTMSANPGGSGVLAGTINGCVYAETANTLAGTTKINGCSSSAAPEPQSGALMGLALIGGVLLFQKFRTAPVLRPAYSCL
jgi:hypothetical protein